MMRAEKTARQRKVLWIWILGLLLFGFLCVGVLHFVLYGGLFWVQRATVDEVQTMPRGRVASGIATQMVGDSVLRALLGPQHILFWKIGKDPVLAPNMFPGIAAVRIEAGLWRREVKITVREREVSGIWCRIAGECFGFDETGIAFARVPTAFGSLILTVYDTEQRPVFLGAAVPQKREWTRNILETARIMKTNQLPITAIRVRELLLREWEAEAEGKIFLYSFDFLPERLAELLAALRQKQDFQGAARVDFRVPNRIYYR